MTDKVLFAFVLMPFDSKFDDIYNLGIKEAAAKVEFKAERLSEQIFIEGMMDRIYRQIELADVVIADMSDKNPNVFYEVGYAHAKDKLCVLQTGDAKDIPFDLQHRRHIVYRGSITVLRQELIKNLEWAKTEIENIRRSQIRVDFKQPQGKLVVTDWEAEASVNFRVDLYNDSNKPSAEINAVYFYTGSLWEIKQGDKSSPYTNSDIPRFKRRYFLTPPVTKLQSGSWAQLQFSGSRIVADKYFGDEIKDKYTLGGMSVLRFVTSEGIFDYEWPINFDVSLMTF